MKDRPGHDIRYALNSSKLKKELKWHPKTTLSDGIKKTFQWYFENKKYYLSFKKSDINKRLGCQKINNKIGSGKWNRTTDLRLMSPAL